MNIENLAVYSVFLLFVPLFNVYFYYYIVFFINYTLSLESFV